MDAHSPKVPMGTEIVMNGKTCKVEDTGNFARYGTDFDIYFDSHAAAQEEYCYKNAMIINKKQLKPGDLIFYSYEETGEFRNISHVAIYVGGWEDGPCGKPVKGRGA